MATNQGRRIFCIEQEKAIAAEYESGLSMSQLALKWGVCPYTIWKALLRQEVQIRPTGGVRKHTLNEAAFDNAENNPDAAYFAGLLFADGCIHRGKWKNVVSIALAGEDGILVERLRDFLGSTHRLRREVPNRGYATNTVRTHLSIGSLRLVQALGQYGVTSRKSLTATVPDVMLYNRDWWRGIVDGDGWVSLAKRIGVVGVVGTWQTCDAFLKFCQTVTETNTKPTRLGSIWQCRLSHSRAYRVVTALYSGCSISLPRKHEQVNAIIELARSKGWSLTGHTKTGPKPRQGN